MCHAKAVVLGESLQRPWVIRSRRSAENAQGLAKILEILLRNCCFVRKRKKWVLVCNGGARVYCLGVGATAAVKIRWFSQVYLDCSRAPRQVNNRRRTKAKTHAVRLYCWNRLKLGGRDGGR